MTCVCELLPIACPVCTEPVTLDELRMLYAVAVLAAHGGCVSEAARTADVERSSMQRMLKRFGIDRRALVRCTGEAHSTRPSHATEEQLHAAPHAPAR